MFFVTDTHSFLWYLTEDERLSKKANQTFNLAEIGKTVIFIPTIVFAESFHITKKKKVDLEFIKVIEKIRDGLNFTSYPLDMNVIIKLQNLEKLSELHDKIIVATTLILNAKLITKDKNIRDSKYVDTIW